MITKCQNTLKRISYTTNKLLRGLKRTGEMCGDYEEADLYLRLKVHTIYLQKQDFSMRHNQ